MKIVIDCRFWGAKHTGLGIYTQYLVENLAKIDFKNDYVLLVRAGDLGSTDLPKNFSKKTVDINAYSLKEQLVMPWILYGLKPNLVHFPSINVPVLYLGKYIVTVHDLIKHFFRGTQTTTRSHSVYWFKFIAYLLVFRWIVFWSRKILVPSKTVKGELTKEFAVSPLKIAVTYEASVMKTGFREKKRERTLPEKFAIYTGNAYPHKNLSRLIRVWQSVYARTNTELVIVGSRSVFISRVKDIIKSEKAADYVRLLGYISPEELPLIYDQALIYVFPSLSEGFGLPGLDAMKVGLPVVCSDIPVLKEIYEDSASYFDPRDEHNMTSVIFQTINDENLRKTLIKKGYVQAAKYSWKEMAEKSLSVYYSI